MPNDSDKSPRLYSSSIGCRERACRDFGSLPTQHMRSEFDHSRELSATNRKRSNSFAGRLTLAPAGGVFWRTIVAHLEVEPFFVSRGCDDLTGCRLIASLFV